MLTSMRASVPGLEIAWIGQTKESVIKDGPKKGQVIAPKPSMQFSTKNDNGQVITFYGNAYDQFDKSLKVGDVVDAEFKIRAFKDGLYCDIIKVKPVMGAKK